MFSLLPIKPEGLEQKNSDRELLRTAIMAELDAINLYEQMASSTGSESLRKIFLDIAREEKTHVGEFQSLLVNLDPEHAEELLAGDREVREKTGAGAEAA